MTREGFQAVGVDGVRGGVKGDGGALVGGTNLGELLEERLDAGLVQTELFKEVVADVFGKTFLIRKIVFALPGFDVVNRLSRRNEVLRDRKELAEPAHFEKAARWCALWGVIGFLPGCIDQWSNLILSGIYLNGPTPGVIGVLRSPLFFRTLFMLCWLLVFCRPGLARSLGFCVLPWLLVMIVAPLTGVMM